MADYDQLLKDRQAKADAMMKSRCYAAGGAVKHHEDAAMDKKLIKSEFKKLEKKDAGDEKPVARADKMARGGRTKKDSKVQVNVIAGGPPAAPMVRPPMKSGGRVKLDAGAGGAKGRLEKIKMYGKK